jgi:VIT1/CCC1 family predicted Fe2+/Mn2+ transporter
MMRFELGLERPDPSRAWKSALTIALAYTVRLFPQRVLFSDSCAGRLRLSVGITLFALAVFGGIKGRFTGVPVLRSAAQTTLIGGLAAAAAFWGLHAGLGSARVSVLRIGMFGRIPA